MHPQMLITMWSFVPWREKIIDEPGQQYTIL